MDPEEKPFNRRRHSARDPRNLTDFGLWTILLSSRKAAALVTTQLEVIDGFTAAELAALPGFGKARAARAAAVLELARRLSDYLQPDRPSIKSASDAYYLVRPKLYGMRQELFLAVALDNRLRAYRIIEIARGSANSVCVNPREVFHSLVREAATATIVAHNHPSGDPAPSEQDLELTRTLKEAGALLSIPLLDHLIIGNGSFTSLAETGAL